MLDLFQQWTYYYKIINQNLNVKLGTTTKVKKMVSDITEKDPEVSTN